MKSNYKEKYCCFKKKLTRAEIAAATNSHQETAKLYQEELKILQENRSLEFRPELEFIKYKENLPVNSQEIEVQIIILLRVKTNKLKLDYFKGPEWFTFYQIPFNKLFKYIEPGEEFELCCSYIEIEDRHHVGAVVNINFQDVFGQKYYQMLMLNKNGDADIFDPSPINKKEPEGS